MPVALSCGRQLACNRELHFRVPGEFVDLRNAKLGDGFSWIDTALNCESAVWRKTHLRLSEGEPRTKVSQYLAVSVHGGRVTVYSSPTLPGQPVPGEDKSKGRVAHNPTGTHDLGFLGFFRCADVDLIGFITPPVRLRTHCGRPRRRRRS
jgi:hypothetical protein